MRTVSFFIPPTYHMKLSVPNTSWLDKYNKMTVGYNYISYRIGANWDTRWCKMRQCLTLPQSNLSYCAPIWLCYYNHDFQKCFVNLYQIAVSCLEEQILNFWLTKTVMKCYRLDCTYHKFPSLWKKYLCHHFSRWTYFFIPQIGQTTGKCLKGRDW